MKYRYAIVKAIYFHGDRRGYQILNGNRKYRHYKSAERTYQELERRWDDAARAGRIHPSLQGRFRDTHKLVEIKDGETIDDAVAKLHEGAYYIGTAWLPATPPK